MKPMMISPLIAMRPLRRGTAKRIRQGRSVALAALIAAAAVLPLLTGSAAASCAPWETDCNGPALNGGTTDGYGNNWNSNLGGGVSDQNGRSWGETASGTARRSDGFEVEQNLGGGYRDNKGNTYSKNWNGDWQSSDGTTCSETLGSVWVCKK